MTSKQEFWSQWFQEEEGFCFYCRKQKITPLNFEFGYFGKNENILGTNCSCIIRKPICFQCSGHLRQVNGNNQLLARSLNLIEQRIPERDRECFLQNLSPEKNQRKKQYLKEFTLAFLEALCEARLDSQEKIENAIEILSEMDQFSLRAKIRHLKLTTQMSERICVLCLAQTTSVEEFFCKKCLENKQPRPF